MRAIKGMHEFAESEKDALTMLNNYCPENFYKGTIRCCEVMKIKSCPICGDVPVIKVQPIRGYEPDVDYIINCSNIECPLFCCIQTCSTVYHSAAEAERIVKEKWNDYCYHVEKLLKEKD